MLPTFHLPSAHAPERGRPPAFTTALGKEQALKGPLSKCAIYRRDYKTGGPPRNAGERARLEQPRLRRKEKKQNAGRKRDMRRSGRRKDGGEVLKEAPCVCVCVCVFPCRACALTGGRAEGEKTAPTCGRGYSPPVLEMAKLALPVTCEPTCKI